uniref:Uncharacterized protein n=1 Tax=Neobodo designis TaxID=312471 RepID=A0A7S1PK57_NEODS|eukprot:CAMPEP_0174856536 /NCGR_PEP_ID=MMETSP1114-20130205/36088_1 /TAXON_ID=312471 /ORGANISM="Neobodo designis, Strain CCAP 1951/1" /LENGTH=114 /DNA_ID=CAMNT_0016091337 /DNA_START=80 /DNA_END=424 /DNA_ORIENTATION=-
MNDAELLRAEAASARESTRRVQASSRTLHRQLDERLQRLAELEEAFERLAAQHSSNDASGTSLCASHAEPTAPVVDAEARVERAEAKAALALAQLELVDVISRVATLTASELRL